MEAQNTRRGAQQPIGAARGQARCNLGTTPRVGAEHGKIRQAEARAGRGLWFGVCAILAVGGGLARADTIELKSAARVRGGTVTLAEVARLDGAYAESLGGRVVAERLDEPGASITLGVEDVRAQLDGNGDHVRWGRVALTGATVTVTRVDEAPAQPAAAVAHEPAVGAIAATALDLADVRGHIARRLALRLGVELPDLRLTFAAADRELLTTTAAGRTVEVEADTTGANAPVTVRVFSGDRVVASGTTRVGVEIRRNVAVAKAALRKGDVIGAGDVAEEMQWVEPGTRAALVRDAVGGVVRTRLVAGQRVLLEDVQAAVVVKRGDLVNVHSTAGTVALKTLARALGNGRVGDTVEFQALDDKARKFKARVDAPGRAVTGLGAGGTGAIEDGPPLDNGDGQPAAPAVGQPLTATRSAQDGTRPAGWDVMQANTPMNAASAFAERGGRTAEPSPLEILRNSDAELTRLTDSGEITAPALADRSGQRASVGGVVVERTTGADGVVKMRIKPNDPKQRPRTLSFIPLEDR